MKVLIALITAASALAVGAMARAQSPSQPGRIAIVDLDRVFKEYYKTGLGSAKLKETADSFKKEHDEILAEYREQVEALAKLREEQEKPEYTPEVREQKRRAYTEKLTETSKRQREIEEYGRSHQRIFEEQQQRMRQSIIKDINEVVNKKAREEGYMLVLDKSGLSFNQVPTIVYSQDTLDITDDIIKSLNKDQPKAAEASKPAPKKEEQN
jgi:Skp family chaperone for outer membrane proteins